MIENSHEADLDMVREFLKKTPSPSLQDLLNYEPETPYSVQDWKKFVDSDPQHFIDVFREAGQPTLKGFPETELKEIVPEEHINKLLTVKGKVVATSDNEPYPYRLCFSCRNCAETQMIKDGKKPKKDCCSESDPQILIDESEILSSQIIKIQEIVPNSTPAKMTLRVIGKSQMWKTGPGKNIEALGFYRLDPIIERKTNRINFIRRFETYSVAGLSAEDEAFRPVAADIERFQKDIEQPQFWEMMTGSIAPHISGFPEVKETLALLLASMDQDPLNCLLVGDPSTAKSEFLLYAAKLSASGIYNSFAGAKWPALSAHAQQDGETGSWLIQPGALALADLACLDEMHTIDEEVAGKMNEAGEQKTVSYMKGGQVGTLPARCAWLFASNSFYGDWRSDLGISENLKFLGKAREALISRFPLIFIIIDTVDDTNDRKIAKAVLEKNSAKAISKYFEDWQRDGNTYYGFKTLKKFFIWLKTLPVPEIPDSLNQEIENWYADTRAAQKLNRLIKARFLDKAVKVCKYHARILGKAVCDSTDFDYAKDLLKKSMDAAAFIPETGEIDSNVLNGSKPKHEIKKKEDREEEFWSSFDHLLNQTGREYVTTSELIDALEGKSWKKHDVERMIEQANRAGKIVQRFGPERWSKA